MNTLEKIGELVRNEYEHSNSQMESLRSEIDAQWRKQLARRRVIRVAMAVAAVLIAVAGIGAWLSFHNRLEVRNGSERVARGSVVNSANATLQFDDGSSVRLVTESVVRVVESTPRDVRLGLERGTIEAELIPNQNIAWQFDCGLWTVRVFGTAFRIQRDADAFELVVHRGAVKVSGPSVEMVVTKGQRVSAIRGVLLASPSSPADGGLFDADLPALAELEAPVEPKPPDRPNAKALALAHQTPSKRQTNKAPSNAAAVAQQVALSWQALAEQGQFRAALTALRLLDTDTLITEASARESLLLADTARLAGDLALARKALAHATVAFDTPTRAAAYFRMGRLEADAGNDAAALEAFTQTLAASPNPALDETVRGRRLELLARMGKSQSAREEARVYRLRHPLGAYRALADRLAGE